MAEPSLAADRPTAPAGSAPVRRDPGSVAIAAVASVLAVIVGLMVLIWLVLFITKGRFLKPTFEKFASRATERQVRVAGEFQLYFNPIDIKFVADGLTVSNPAWAPRPDFFASKHIETRVRTFPLIFGKRRAEFLVLDGGQVDAEWDARRRNTWTFGDPNVKGKPFQWPVIERAIVTGTQARYVDPQLQIVTDVKVDTIRAGGTTITDNRINFTGDGTLRGKRFVMNGGILSPNSTVTFGRTKLVLHAQSGPTLLDLNGVLPAATQIQGSDLNLTVRGPNLRLLFDFLGVAVPDTRRYRFNSKLTKAGGEWRFTRLGGFFGDSDLAGKMTISLPNDRVLIVADIASKSVDMIDVGPFVGYSPARLDAQGKSGTITRVNGTPRLLPDAPLRADALSVFDAKVDYKVTRIRADNLPISDVALKLDLDRGLLKLSPLTMNFSGGALSSDIVIDSRQKPVFTDYDIRLATTPMGKLLKGFGVEESGTTGAVRARVKMSGRGDTVHDSLAASNGRIAIVLPKGTFWTRNIQLAEFDVGTFVQKMFQDKLKKPVEINCGLIGFTVRNGIAAADPILIDTEKNVMTATGGFSFKDESLDIRFRADAKKFSVFSGQSPVGINGHFAAPGIQIITPELLARGGAAVALGLVASPVGAVLAFVDPGDAKSAACGPVLAGARAGAQKTVDGDARKDVGNGKAGSGAKKERKKFLGIF
ncbi:AsmA family protein [Sphingomonas solaris]|uniref:AsmA family protein n=1 Tax=Alterirhizorhabdus solaris TaxID=2529389 RepID=A0A558QTX3_9SPHN|nr:AsmA family protein [Sphingomonas solaris]TVV70584.1 AsmA family protein [Sphingomonas solaris]